MMCYNCGRMIDDDSAFCPFCGKKIEYNYFNKSSYNSVNTTYNPNQYNQSVSNYGYYNSGESKKNGIGIIIVVDIIIMATVLLIMFIVFEMKLSSISGNNYSSNYDIDNNNTESYSASKNEYVGKWIIDKDGDGQEVNTLTINSDGTYGYDRFGSGIPDMGTWSENDHGGISFRSSEGGYSQGELLESGGLKTTDISHTTNSVGSYVYSKSY